MTTNPTPPADAPTPTPPFNVGPKDEREVPAQLDEVLDRMAWLMDYLRDRPYYYGIVKDGRQLLRLAAAREHAPREDVREKVRKVLGTPDELAEHLNELGWRSSCDAQWDNLRAWHSGLSERILSLFAPPSLPSPAAPSLAVPDDCRPNEDELALMKSPMWGAIAPVIREYYAGHSDMACLHLLRAIRSAAPTVQPADALREAIAKELRLTPKSVVVTRILQLLPPVANDGAVLGEDTLACRKDRLRLNHLIHYGEIMPVGAKDRGDGLPEGAFDQTAVRADIDRRWGLEKQFNLWKTAARAQSAGRGEAGL